jgi:hypothetical protein
MKQPTISATIAFIQIAHKGQMYGDKPFYTHPVSLMRSLPENAPHEVKLAALLHDVVEDTEHTASSLRERGYSDYVIRLVLQLSRPEGEDRPTYMNWIRGLADTSDIWLIRIKRLDNMLNLIGRPEMIGRYSRSMKILMDREQQIVSEGIPIPTEEPPTVVEEQAFTDTAEDIDRYISFDPCPYCGGSGCAADVKKELSCKTS